MKLKLFLFACAIVLFTACGNEPKKTETKTDEIPEIRDDKEEMVIKETPISLEDQIKTIKTNFTSIENQLASLDKKMATEDFSGGTAELEGYFKNNKPVKLVKMEAAGHGSMQVAYYFYNNELFFVHEQEYEEASINGPYTGKEKRFYIANGKLIRVLTKEKTIKTGDLEMANVPNVDVTDKWEDKNETVANHIKAARKMSGMLLETSVGLENGRWISQDDANAGIEIKDGKLIMFYKSAEVTSNEVFDYKLSENEGVEYMTLTDKDGEELKYSILEYTDDIFIMSYLARGNRLTYVKENN